MKSQGGGVMWPLRCQECGNQAKKECVYMRCRTCCRNKGFQCQTHVKSTWIPLYRRRQRQQQLAAVLPHHFQGHNPRRHRQILPSGSEASNFPVEVHAMAAFCCIRVSSLDDALEEYAYQTSVSIGGHVFRGILYDQGPDSCYNTGESSSPELQRPKLVNAAALADVTTSSANAEQFPPPCPSPFSALIPGTQFLQRPKSATICTWRELGD